VVGPEEGRVFHNRLTHSLKVGQLARRIAENVAVGMKQKGLTGRPPDPEVAEAAGFAHDLGHPPFGHVAEKVLDELVRNHGLEDGYEGNAQTFRIVCKLAVRSKDYQGLDLTRAALNAILKYPWFCNENESHPTKRGAYRTETVDFNFCRNGQPSQRQSIEAQCMELADDIAYSVGDVEDFYRAGLVPLDQLAYSGDDKTSAEARGKTGEDTRRSREAKRFLTKTFERLNISTESAQDVYARELDLVMGLVPDGAYCGSEEQRSALRHWTSTGIQEFVNSIEVGSDDYGPRATLPSDMEYRSWILKQLTWHYVILNPRLSTQQVGFERVVRELFAIYLEAVQREKWHVLPPRYREGIPANEEAFAGLCPCQSRPRLVADIISGMTDREALMMHRRLTGVAPGSVLDATVL